MQISRYSLFILVAAVCASPLPARSADNAAQAKAREALEKSLNEQPPQSPGVVPAPAAKAPPVSVSAPPPVVKSTSGPVVVQQPVSAAAPKLQSADPEAIARARAALRATMESAEQPQQAPPVFVAPAAQSTSAPVVQAPIAPAVQPTAAPAAQTAAHPPIEPAFDTAVVAAPEANDAAIAKARGAVRQTVSQPAPEGAASQALARPVAVETPKTAAPRKQAPTFQPIEGPSLPISADKQQRLADLLTKYKADEITPDQYHAERAKILAGP